MSKSTKRFKKRLTELLDKGFISKTELHHKTGLSRPTIDRYLAKTSPDLETLDKIADALGYESAELIKSDREEISKPHTLNDCLDTIVKAIAEAKDYDPQIASRDLKKKCESEGERAKPDQEKHIRAADSGHKKNK